MNSSPPKVCSRPKHDICGYDLIEIQALCRGNQVKMRSYWNRVTLYPVILLMRRDPYRHRDNSHGTSEAETTVLQLEAKEHQGKQMNTRDWREGFSPLESSERAWPCQHLDLGSVASRTGKQQTSVVLSHPVCGVLLQQL